MVRAPLTPEQIAAGRRLGAVLREWRGPRTVAEVAEGAGISPETLRKIESGRLLTPSFATVVALGRSLDVPVELLADAVAGAAPMPSARSTV
ncbi:helix-turn-helix domain-containing protein [Gordonia sp. NPDC062954]|jgi:transcriptional regulator with XRE-family HTH domain|uniref:Helix-turn-helix transcriptional regulator n=1 Tax=Gordonia aquimaris TaxID=2984863 RepID=A0A9X3D3A3_9ACTN|nr:MULTISPECIES: helix-turn-helix transcriptional regulator [Gordonia]MAU81108.1 transcriptional regulator [Gordonia sp. (in: high G+C Gram-positive bacteria)]MCX2963925.1 helix-turn-helix transcriptional regulator [Gordonia aquimaris]